MRTREIWTSQWITQQWYLSCERLFQRIVWLRDFEISYGELPQIATSAAHQQDKKTSTWLRRRHPKRRRSLSFSSRLHDRELHRHHALTPGPRHRLQSQSEKLPCTHGSRRTFGHRSLQRDCQNNFNPWLGVHVQINTSDHDCVDLIHGGSGFQKCWICNEAEQKEDHSICECHLLEHGQTRRRSWWYSNEAAQSVYARRRTTRQCLWEHGSQCY